MKTTRYYMTHLQRYFDKHYGEYGDTAGWLVNPKPNQWKFIILELGLTVTLTCTDNGFVVEQREKTHKGVDIHEKQQSLRND